MSGRCWRMRADTADGIAPICSTANSPWSVDVNQTRHSTGNSSVAIPDPRLTDRPGLGAAPPHVTATGVRCRSVPADIGRNKRIRSPVSVIRWPQNQGWIETCALSISLSPPLLSLSLLVCYFYLCFSGLLVSGFLGLCFHAFMFLCFHAFLFLCFHAFLFLCFSVFLVFYPFGFFNFTSYSIGLPPVAWQLHGLSAMQGLKYRCCSVPF